MYEVTIAIPVYNVEPYIEKCLMSALEQSFSSIEFLVIDDKGSDGSMDVVRKLQRVHSRGKDIRIIDNISNLGISETRNVALEEASGKYLFFLDSDDYISSDCIKVMYDAMVKENVEMVFASFCVTDIIKIRKKYELPYIVSHKINELASLRYGKLHSLLQTYLWNILYDLSFLRQHNFHFKKVEFCEDSLFWYDVYPVVSSFVLLPNVTYYYVHRNNSSSHYDDRAQIPLSELKTQIYIRNYGKKKMMDLQNKPYFYDMVISVIRYSYKGAFSILKNYDRFYPPMHYELIEELLDFPMSFCQIVTAKRHRIEILFYYIMSRIRSSFVSKKILLLLEKCYYALQKKV